MHAVKGNLANTVCKRKHQHIASVPVLGGPCMLFSNFYSFLWGQGYGGGGGVGGVGWIFFFFLPSPARCHPDLKPRGGSLGYKDVRFLALETKPIALDNGALQQDERARTPSAVRRYTDHVFHAHYVRKQAQAYFSGSDHLAS